MCDVDATILCHYASGQEYTGKHLNALLASVTGSHKGKRGKQKFFGFFDEGEMKR